MTTSIITLSTVDTDITTGVKEAWYLPDNYRISDIYAVAYEAPVGGNIEVEVTVDDNIVSSSNFIINENARHSKSANAPVITYNVWSKSQWVKVEIKGIGSTGKGIKLYIEYEIL